MSELRILCDQPIGQIKAELAGVSQGGNADSYLKPQVLTAIKGLPISLVRLEAVTNNTSYTLFDPETGKYDWSKLDQEIETIQKSGAQIVLDIFSTPKWLASDPDQKMGAWYFSAPNDERRWAKYVGDIVRHVNIDRKYNIKYWEFWNEPSGGYFFTAWRFGPEKFWRLYRVTAQAIKSADPTALVGGFGDNANYPEHYKNFFTWCQSNNVPIDFVTLHWYGEWPTPDGENQPALYYHYAKTIEGLYRGCFKKEVPIFYSEWNLQAESDRMPAVKQAAFMGSAYFWMQESPVTGSMFFRIENYSGTRGALLDDQYQPRVAFRILKMFTMLEKTRVNVRDVHGDVTVLAGRSNKKLTVMISRFNPDSSSPMRNQIVLLASHGFSGPCRVTTYLENAETAGKIGPLVPKTQTTMQADPAGIRVGPIPMENYSVALVVIEKI
jgi:xylan 1,4-beta-xylosidase